MTPARILITGSTGFVAGYLIPSLSRRYPAAEIARLGPANSSDTAVIPVDLLDPGALCAAVSKTKPDIVVHLAAQASVATSAASSSLTWSVNLTGSLNLAQAVAQHVPNATLLFASSAEVYGASFLGSPVCETSPLHPMNTYAKSKALAEAMFADVLPRSTRLIVARPFNHTGPGQREDFVLPSFAAQIARIEAGRQPPLIQVGNLDVRRDFLDVRDVVEAYSALLAAADRLPTRFTCNIASGQPRSLRDLLDLLSRFSRVPFSIEVDPARLRPVDLPVAFAEPTLLRAMVGWYPQWSIDDTVLSLLETARANLAATGKTDLQA